MHATLATPVTYAIGSLPELTRSLARTLGHVFVADYDPEYDYTSISATVPGTDLLWYLTGSDTGILVEVCSVDCGVDRWKDGVAAADVLDTLRRLIADEPPPVGGSRDTGPF